MNTDILKNYSTRLILELLDKHEGKKGLKKVQRALNEMGKNLVVDGVIGNITMKAIKSVSNKELHKIIYKKENQLIKDKEISTTESGNRPSWIKLAYKELGTKEIKGSSGSNPRVEQYHDAAGIAWADDDVPWCGSFIGFIMIKAGKGSVKNAPRAKAWLKYGKRTSKPVLGAIAVKSRSGGGHVGFVVGKSKNNKYLYILGGNQNDEVNIKRYARSVFIDYRVPTDYENKYRLPIMTGNSRVTSES